MYRHHNFEERLNIVSRLQSGESLESLCKDLKIDKKMVRLWYLRYKKYGEEVYVVSVILIIQQTKNW